MVCGDAAITRVAESVLREMDLWGITSVLHGNCAEWQRTPTALGAGLKVKGKPVPCPIDRGVAEEACEEEEGSCDTA